MTTHNLFVSHVHEDDGRLQDLKGLLEKRGYTIRDGSIDSRKPNNAKSPDYIKQQILAPGIKWAGALVVLISPKTHESKWVNWEIEYAKRLGKRIVGVYAYGGTTADLPEAFQKYGDALVGWQADRLMDAVQGKVNNWEGPDGASITRPGWDIVRHTC